MMRALAASLAVLVLGACVSTQGCSKPAAPAGYEVVTIDGRDFTLELVADQATREKGLGGVESIPENGGMLFSFPDSQIRQFVMRDCLVPIDIIFLDSDGRIVAMHHMPVEEPRGADETALQYERRLKRYSSRFNARYAIELQGGMLDELDLQSGQQIRLDTKRLEGMTD
tara:strand:+ start:10066 stop:10575 length:510 start_codon:yes stop_codon:yes gene_type:complete